MCDKPKIVCLCGSTKFKHQFIQTNFEQSMAGNIVLSVGWFSHADKDVYLPTSEEKKLLDKVYKHKIDLSDEIIVINVDHYIGDSTKDEIAYAVKKGKTITWLLSPNDNELKLLRQ